MKIRNKILIYFSATVIVFTVLSSVVVYILFSEYREEEFQQRQKQKIEVTISLLNEYQEMTEGLTMILDKLSIHDFYDEKLLIFDQHKNPIYKSIDDLVIESYKDILTQLSPAKQWIETKESQYDLIGVYIEQDNQSFYAISKAYDEFGYTKLEFLRNTLLITTIIIAIIVLLISYYLSNLISRPINMLSDELNHFNVDSDEYAVLEVSSGSFEMEYLIDKFNQMIRRTNESFQFQKNAIQHISHEIKTPLTILVTELERALQEEDEQKKDKIIQEQIIKAKYLGEVMHTLLEISKIESGKNLWKKKIRIDDLVFEIIEELNVLSPGFKFEIELMPVDIDESKLMPNINRLLMKQALSNILENAIKYSREKTAKIILNASQREGLNIEIQNPGDTLSDEDLKFLFRHHFRAEEQIEVPGFGLGLVLTQKILQLHGGRVAYKRMGDDINSSFGVVKSLIIS